MGHRLPRDQANAARALDEAPARERAHVWGPRLRGASGACALADQTRVLPARLHGPFQQQIHHHLRQVAARPSLSQRRSVVKGSHVVLRRKTVSKPFEFRLCKGLAGSIGVGLGKRKFSRRSPRGKRAPAALLPFPRGAHQRRKQRPFRYPRLLLPTREPPSGAGTTLRAARGRGTAAGCSPSARPPAPELNPTLPGPPWPVSGQAL